MSNHNIRVLTSFLNSINTNNKYCIDELKELIKENQNKIIKNKVNELIRYLENLNSFIDDEILRELEQIKKVEDDF